jgi:hypothetical protein
MALVTRPVAAFRKAEVGLPHVSQEARDQLDDLGLVDDDRTPDMRKAPVAAEALQMNRPSSHHNHTKEF